MSKKVKELKAGEVWGDLEILYKVEDGGKYLKYHCKCHHIKENGEECGNEKDIMHYNIIRHKTTTCGCGMWKKKHGYANTPTWQVWCDMKSRCYDKNQPSYKNYGGRGIKVCDRWLESFNNFLEDMGEKPFDRTIDRIDVNGNYCKENCRWATKEEQENNKRSNQFYTYNNVTLTIAQWARKYNMPYERLRQRLSVGWDFELAITAPQYYRRSKEDYNV